MVDLPLQASDLLSVDICCAHRKAGVADVIVSKVIKAVDSQPHALSRHLTECTSCGSNRTSIYSFTDIKNIFIHTPSQYILNFIFLNQLV